MSDRYTIRTHTVHPRGFTLHLAQLATLDIELLGSTLLYKWVEPSTDFVGNFTRARSMVKPCPCDNVKIWQYLLLSLWRIQLKGISSTASIRN